MAEANFRMSADEPSTSTGRPPIYTDELAETICERMAGGESLLQICRDGAMPSYSTVMKWAATMPTFAENYTRAREALLEHHGQELVEIADDASNDWMDRETRDGRMERCLDREHVERSKLRIETRKWVLARLLPKKYGESVLNKNQMLDANGNPMTPGPTFVIAREEAKKIAEDLDSKV